MFYKLWWPLVLTLIIEYPIAQLLWLLMKEEKKSKLNLWKNRIIIIPAIIVNVLTNPAINLFYRYMYINKILEENVLWMVITALEVVVFIVEGILYKFLLNSSWKHAFMISFTVNYTSYMAGFLL